MEVELHFLAPDPEFGMFLAGHLELADDHFSVLVDLSGCEEERCRGFTSEIIDSLPSLNPDSKGFATEALLSELEPLASDQHPITTEIVVDGLGATSLEIYGDSRVLLIYEFCHDLEELRRFVTVKWHYGDGAPEHTVSIA